MCVSYFPEGNLRIFASKRAAVQVSFHITRLSPDGRIQREPSVYSEIQVSNETWENNRDTSLWDFFEWRIPQLS